MNSSELLQLLNQAIEDAEKSGTKQISLNNLKIFSKKLEELAAKFPKNLSEADLEKYKAELSVWVAKQNFSHSTSIELLRATIQTGDAALKSAILINGGASAALLAFIGSAWS